MVKPTDAWPGPPPHYLVEGYQPRPGGAGLRHPPPGNEDDAPTKDKIEMKRNKLSKKQYAKASDSLSREQLLDDIREIAESQSSRATDLMMRSPLMKSTVARLDKVLSLAEKRESARLTAFFAGIAVGVFVVSVLWLAAGLPGLL